MGYSSGDVARTEAQHCRFPREVRPVPRHLRPCSADPAPTLQNHLSTCRPLRHDARIGAGLVERRECVLDVGTRAGGHGTGCRDKHRPVSGARSTRRKRPRRRGRRGRLPPVGTLPTSNTHCRTFCRISAPRAEHGRTSRGLAYPLTPERGASRVESYKRYGRPVEARRVRYEDVV